MKNIYQVQWPILSVTLKLIMLMKDGYLATRYGMIASWVNMLISSLQFTYADVATYLLFEYAISNIPGALQLYPTLAKQRESVTKMKNIARWLKERPETAL